MILFESGRFYIDYGLDDCPVWTGAERGTVMTCIHMLRNRMPMIKQDVALERTRSAQREFTNQALWLRRLDQLWQMLHRMDADIRASQNAIRFRKKDLGLEVSARAEGMPMTWIATLNINTGPRINFFRQSISSQVATIFHELTHFYGTDDEGRDLNNAHTLEGMLRNGASTASMLERARYRTRRGLQ